MVGSNLGPYSILEKIGAGGMGEVFRAHDPKLQRDVAIKVLPPEFTRDAERLARFEREAQAVAALSHPNILAIYDFGTEGDTTFAVMELLEGETLRQLVARGPIPPRKALDYARQIAEGLAAAHDKGIVRRDLKPENIFVSRDGRIKILDFGLARQTSLTGSATDTHSPTLADATEAGAVLGTVGYMSPEQVKGEPADGRSDIFALGLVLHEMLSGARAFDRQTGVEIMTAILREEPPDLVTSVSDLSPSVDRLVRHCLEKRPEERFQSARDLAFDLEAAAGLSTTGVVPQFEAEPPTLRGWRWWALALALPLLLATYLAVYRMAASSSHQEPARFQRLTFQRGSLSGARLSPDGQTVVYSASWQGQPFELYSTRLDSPESKSLGLPSAALFAISPGGEMAIGLDPLLTLWPFGRLATVPLLGGAPREVAGVVTGADWGADGQTLVITNAFEATGSLESPPGNSIFETSGRLTSPRLSPDGQWIAVCHHPNVTDTRGQILVVDLQGSSKTLSRFFSDLRGIDWSADGSEDRDLSVFEWTLIRDVSRDGKTLLLAETGDATGAEYATYLRSGDGSPPIRLGIGVAQSLSPSGRFALSRSADSSQLFLYPTGAGQDRTFQPEGIETFGPSQLLDDERALVTAAETGGAPRVYLLDLSTSQIEPLTESPSWLGPVSPDGRWFVELEGSSSQVTSVDGGEPRAIPGLRAEDFLLQWTEDGTALYLTPDFSRLPLQVDTLDLATGERRLFREFEPTDRAGAGAITSFRINPAGTAWAYSYPRIFSELHLVEGLR